MRRVVAIVGCVVLSSTACAFQGLNSLRLPGTVGRGPEGVVYHIEIANVGTLEPNSPVMINDVVVGSVVRMRLKDWHADVEVSVIPTAVVSANAVATIGQTSLLGSQHLALNPPLGEAPIGRMQPGATIPLSRASTYPSTEQTLSALSAVVNTGGLGQIGDIVHNFNVMLTGNQDAIRDLLAQLDSFVGTFNDQRDNIIATIQGLNAVAATFANQRDVVSRALQKIPQALDVLIREEPRLTAALDKLRVFSHTATRLVNDTQADLVHNLQNLEPTIRALADVGPDLDAAIAYLPVFPYGQNIIDRALRGDYFNLYSVFDLTVPRLKRGLLLGTRWGQEGMSMVPAPGDAGYNRYYTTHPLTVGVDPPPPQDPTGCTLTTWICSQPIPTAEAPPPVAPAESPAPANQGGG
ncbi:MCE family protein [Mycolicibacterium sp. BK634]|uniref:MCE family protein n=1 Tax=Mycolicibacterium sp. BK634 TaxID=2587099 RepID=UPI00351D9782